MNLVRDVQSNKKGFCRHRNSKRMRRESMGPLLNGAGELVTNDMEKAMVLSAFPP